MAIVCIFALFLAKKSKKSFSRNSIFSLLFFEYESNSHMTLVSDSPHVTSLLRINISKFDWALQANFMLRYSPHVALLLRINISKLGCALQANFMLRYSPHVALLLRINISMIGSPYRFFSFHAIALTSLCSSGSISLNSSATSSLDSLRAIEKEHTVHFA